MGFENCENGNAIDGDGCSSLCVIEAGWNCTGTPTSCTPICGDGIKLPVEGCDDGNKTDSLGCLSNCSS